MYSTDHGFIDLQAQRLFAHIDKQLDQWNNKYRREKFHIRSEETTFTKKGDRQLFETSFPVSMNSNAVCSMKQDTALSNSVNHSNDAPTNHLSEEVTQLIHALVARVDRLEKQLCAAENDRAELRNRLDYTQQQMSNIIEVQNSLQAELAASRSRTQTLSTSQFDEVAANTTHDDSSHLFCDTPTVTQRTGSDPHSEPPAVETTEMVSPGVVDSVFKSNAGGDAFDFGSFPGTSLRRKTAEERKSVLEQLAKRLSIPLNPL